MGILDKLKHAVTGGAAKVELLKVDGAPVGGGLVFVRVAVTAQGSTFTSKGVYVDLHGEDALDEGLIDKAAELFNPDPEFSWPVVENITLEADKTQTYENAVVLPATLDAARTWLVRARVEAPGRDPSSAWTELGKAPETTTPAS